MTVLTILHLALIIRNNSLYTVWQLFTEHTKQTTGTSKQPNKTDFPAQVHLITVILSENVGL